jgi:REP element-mobilizing transposase RayT
MTEYRHSGHAVFDLKYHMILCEARDVVIVRGAVSPDNIHLLLAALPILAPAKLHNT